jgi:hypothetical protein
MPGWARQQWQLRLRHVFRSALLGGVSHSHAAMVDLRYMTSEFGERGRGTGERGGGEVVQEEVWAS